MTWTYFISLETTKDQVRLLIGDTLEVDPQLQDEEIAWLISRHGTDPDSVAIAACDVLIAKYSRLVSTSQDGVSESHAERLENYQKVRASLVEASGSTAAPVFGGAVGADGQPVEPFFTRRTPEMDWTTT